MVEQRRAEDRELLERLLSEQRASLAAEHEAQGEAATRLAEELKAAQAEAEEAKRQLQAGHSPRKAEHSPDSQRPPEKEKRVKRAGPLGDIDLDEGPDAPPVAQQIGMVSVLGAPTRDPS